MAQTVSGNTPSNGPTNSESHAGTLGRVELYCLSIGQVIGAGVITLVGPAIAATGYSAWLSYFLAIVMGFFVIFPIVFITGTLRLSGGYYSLIAALTNKQVAGMYAFAQLTKMMSLSLFGVSLGVYVNSLWPALNPQIVGIVFLTFFYVINLFGIDFMAKAQTLMTWLLIAALMMFIVFGCINYNNPVFNFSDPNFMTNGVSGLWTGAFLFVYSTTGYSMTMNYGAAARNAKKDIPWAILLSVPTLIILYCGVAIAGACVLPMEQVANQPLTLVAKEVLPNILFIAFMIGGPMMALMTTMNSSMPANCIPVVRACEDGWLPKSFISKNKRGSEWKVYSLNYVLGLIPMLLGFNVNIITNNIMLLNSLLSVLYIYAYYQLPKKFPDAWAKSKWHVPNTVYYFFVTCSLIAQCAILYNSSKSLTPVVVGVSVGATVLCAVFGLIRSKDPKINVHSSVWED